MFGGRTSLETGMVNGRRGPFDYILTIY